MKTHRAFFVFCVGVLAAASLLVPAARAQSELPPPLDYTRTIREPGIVFVPYSEMNRGPVYYTEYEQLPTASSTSMTFKRLFVNLSPTAHTHNHYNDFIRRHGVTDARVLPIPAAEACKPTEAILQVLSGMPDRYKPSILGGNYPILCTLSVYFLPEQEQEIRDLIAAGPVIQMAISIPLCAESSPPLDTPRIVSELQARGVVTTMGTGNVTGNVWEVLYASTTLAQENPALFFEPDPQEGWKTFVQQFVIDLETETAMLPSSRARVPAYICTTPEPLDIRF